MRLTPRDASHADTISHTIKRIRPEALNERPANNQIAGPRDSRSFRMPPMSASEAMISDTPLPAQMTEAATPTIPSEPGATTRPRSEAVTDGPVHPPCEMGDTTTRLPPAQSTDILVPCREPFPSAWTNIQDGPEGIPGRSSTLRTAPRDPPDRRENVPCGLLHRSRGQNHVLGLLLGRGAGSAARHEQRNQKIKRSTHKHLALCFNTEVVG